MTKPLAPPFRGPVAVERRPGRRTLSRRECASVALTLFKEAAFWRPATVTVCQTQLDNLEEVRHALDRAIALDPTFTKDPRGVFACTALPKI